MRDEPKVSYSNNVLPKYVIDDIKISKNNRTCE